MRTASLLLVALALGLLAGCGSGKNLLPGSNASAIKQDVDDARDAANSGDCGSAAASIDAARSAVNNLPASVDHRLVSKIRAGLGKISFLAKTRCTQAAATGDTTTTDTTTTDTTTTDTTTTDTTTTDTTTSPPDTTTTDTTTTDTTSTPADTTTTPATGTSDGTGGFGAGGNGAGR